MQTNYERYFGTSEKAAGIISQLCQAIVDCGYCPFWKKENCPNDNTTMALKWLESEATDAD